MAKRTHPQIEAFDARRLVYYRLTSPDEPSILYARDTASIKHGLLLWTSDSTSRIREYS